VVTDAGSVKSPVIAEMSGIVPDPRGFVGAHPMAGSEKSGVRNASPFLFKDRICVVTPIAGTRPDAVRLVERMWHAVGAKTVRMSPARHDSIAARVSHLPHALAAALVQSALSDPAARKIAAGSFLDMTRVAASPPVLWKGIILANRREVLAALADFQKQLGEFERELRGGNGPALAAFLKRAGILRRRVAAGRGSRFS